MKINVSIERLVLDGINVEPAQRPHLQAAVEAELGRLLAEGGVGAEWAGGKAVPSVRASGFEMSGERDAVRLGRQIAGSVYRGISQ